MTNVNEIQDAIFEYYLYVCSHSKYPIQFLDFYRQLLSKCDLTYFFGFLFIYCKKDNTVHVMRNSKLRNTWFNWEVLKKYIETLPKDVIAPIDKKANSAAKNAMQKLGFVCIQETETQYILQRNTQ